MPEAPKATNVQFRREWDKEEYAERAKQKDDAERERMKENEERMKQGKKPRKGRKNDGPLVKPTELMQARETPLDLDKNLNKTLVVQQTSGRGPGVPGFFCETCNRTYKDTTGYLDHINGRARKYPTISANAVEADIMLLDLAKLGQTTKIERSTLEQVRARIAFLREKTRDKTNAASYDFEARLAEVKAREDGIRAEKKAAAKARKDAARLEMMKDVDMAETQDMAAMMGFAGFGSSKK